MDARLIIQKWRAWCDPPLPGLQHNPIIVECVGELLPLAEASLNPTIDELWAAALERGRLEIRDKYEVDGVQRYVQIECKRPDGKRIFCKSSSLRDALMTIVDYGTRPFWGVRKRLRNPLLEWSCEHQLYSTEEAAQNAARELREKYVLMEYEAFEVQT